jgi:hypothetical protein
MGQENTSEAATEIDDDRYDEHGHRLGPDGTWREDPPRTWETNVQHHSPRSKRAHGRRMKMPLA